jgi:hypothetical protein
MAARLLDQPQRIVGIGQVGPDRQRRLDMGLGIRKVGGLVLRRAQQLKHGCIAGLLLQQACID